MPFRPRSAAESHQKTELRTLPKIYKMAYSNFTLNDIEKRLEIEIKSVFGLYNNIEPAEISAH